jgi:hypothetical protein
MIFLPNLKAVVLCPPKNASTTLHHDLTREPWNGIDYRPNDHHGMVVPDEYMNFQIVGAVRDPYERAISLYWHFLFDVCRERADAGAFPRSEVRARAVDVSKEISFVHFMEMLLAQHMCFTRQPERVFLFRSTSDWLEYAHRVDAVIRVERLDQDWDIFCGYKYGETRFSRRNLSTCEPWEIHCSPRAIELVDTWAAEDFNEFGYSRRVCEGSRAN